MSKDEQNFKDSYGNNKDLANGPIENRSCTDILCTLLFVCSLVAMFACAIAGWSKGNPSRLSYPYDADGKACGLDYPDHPYIYFTLPYYDVKSTSNTSMKYLNKTVCVSECPSTKLFQASCSSNIANTTGLTDWNNGSLPCTLNCRPNSQVKNCLPTYTIDPLKSFDLVSYGLNIKDDGFFIYNTTPIFKRICFPYDQNIINYVSNNLDVSQLQRYMSDVGTSWWVILLSVLLAIIFGFIFMFLIQYIAGVLVWSAIFAFVAGLGLLAYAFYRRAQDMENSAEAPNNQDAIKYFKAISYAFWVLTGVMIIAFLCMYNKIRLAIAILKTAANFVKDVPSSLLFPPIISLVVLGYWAVWIVSMVYIYAIGDIQPTSGYPFASVKWDKNTRYMLIYFIFGGIWQTEFILAFSQFVLASATCIWYFSPQGKAHGAISRSVWRGFFKHIGSLAFGSLILAIIKMIRLALAYIDQYCKKTGASENQFVKYLLKCLQCYAWCFECCVRFLNKNAYIQIAITGKNFCAAAKDAFFLVITNPANFTLIMGLGEVFIFIGKLFICVSSTIISYYIMTNVESVKSKLYSSMLPLILIAFIGYAIGVLFMTVYGIAADAILQCYLVDEKVNNGNTQNCPENLREFIVANVKPKEQKPQEPKKEENKV